MGTKASYIAPYNPACNGIVERCNHVIMNCQQRYVKIPLTPWNNVLDYMRLTLNTAFHWSVNYQILSLLMCQNYTFPIGMTNHYTRDVEIVKRLLDLIAARDAAVTDTQTVREENMEDIDR